MTSRKNSKTTGKAARYASEQPARGGVRKFFQRLCIYGLTLIGMLLIYFVMGGDSRELTGIKNAGENPDEAANAGVSHAVGKPAMDENGNPMYQKVSNDWDIYGYGSDEMSTSSGPETGGTSDSETTLDSDLVSDLGLSGSETSETSPTSETSQTPETTGNSNSGSTSDGSSMSGDPGSSYSSGSSDYSSGSSDYSGSSSDYSGSSSTDYSSGSSGYYSGSSDYSTGSSSGASDGAFSSASPSESKAETTQKLMMDLPPETPPIRNYKDGVVTGPDGRPRCNEVKILELGRGKPVKNHYGPAVTDFLDLFDFSITPDWIEANWSSVAIVGPLTTRGYRVPISTGPDPSDLVGSLTYYFDSHLELEKITFEGFTGDMDRILISLKYFNLTKRITSDPNALLYLSEELSGNRRSFLKSYFRLQSRSENEPNQRYWLTIELYPPEK